MLMSQNGRASGATITPPVSGACDEITPSNIPAPVMGRMVMDINAEEFDKSVLAATSDRMCTPAGIREWQSLISGDPGAEAGGGGFVYYGPGRCLSKFGPKYLAGLNIDLKVLCLGKGVGRVD